MTRDQIKQVLDRVRSWPLAPQIDIARVVEIMEQRNRSASRLSDEQLAEVRRRRAKRNPKYRSLAEARKRFRGPGARGPS